MRIVDLVGFNGADSKPHSHNPFKVSSQVCTMEIFNAPLPLGYTRGDKVVTTIAYAPSEGGVMVVGDVGTVQGPSTSTDKERVSCTFNAGTLLELEHTLYVSQNSMPRDNVARLPCQCMAALA